MNRHSRIGVDPPATSYKKPIEVALPFDAINAAAQTMTSAQMADDLSVRPKLFPTLGPQ